MELQTWSRLAFCLLVCTLCVFCCFVPDVEGMIEYIAIPFYLLILILFYLSLSPCFCQACIQEEALRDPMGSTVSPSGATPWSLAALNSLFVSISLHSFFVFIATRNIFSCRIWMVFSVFTCLSALTLVFSFECELALNISRTWMSFD